MATVLFAAAALLGAPPATADARQDFLDQYHARGEYQVISDEMLIYWGHQVLPRQGGREWRAVASQSAQLALLDD